MRIHRVGTITFGCVLVVFGLLFAVHMYMPATLTYDLIFRLWPCILIILGVEVLFTNVKMKGSRFIYDKTSIFLMIVLVFFSIIMAWLDMGMTWQSMYMEKYW